MAYALDKYKLFYVDNQEYQNHQKKHKTSRIPDDQDTTMESKFPAI